MIKINFYLKNLKKGTNKPNLTEEEKEKIQRFNSNLNNVETYVELRARYNKMHLIFNTGVTVKPKNWSPEKQRIKQQVTNSAVQNGLLQHYEDLVIKIYAESKKEGKILSPAEFREKLKPAIEIEPEIEKNVIQYFEEDFIQAKSVKKASFDRVKLSTVKNYKVVLKYLIAYEEKRNLKLTFDSFTIPFYHDYVNFLSKEYTYTKFKETVVGIEDNTVGNAIKFLKTFLNWALEEGLHKNEAFRKFKVIKHDDETIHTLTQSDREKIIGLDLTHNPKLDRVRDILLVGVKVGARISDLLSFTNDNLETINGVPHISYIPKKTAKTNKKKLTIPLSLKTVTILKKYEGKCSTLLPVISDVNFNLYLKELGRLAGLKDAVYITRMVDGEKVNIKKGEKWEVLTSHIMRKTFITDLIHNNCSTQFIMSCTGHKDMKSFMRYPNMDDTSFKIKAFEGLEKSLVC